MVDVVVESSGVGQKLQDHPVSGVLSYTKDTTDVAEMLGIGNLVKWKATGKGPLSSNVAETGAFYASRDDLDLPDIQSALERITWTLRPIRPLLIRPRLIHGLMLLGICSLLIAVGGGMSYTAFRASPSLALACVAVLRRWAASVA